MSDNDDDFEDFDEIKERGKSGVKPVPVPLLDPHQGDAHYYADLTRGPDAKRLFDSASSTGYGTELKEKPSQPYQTMPAELTGELLITRKGPYAEVTTSKYGTADCKYRDGPSKKELCPFEFQPKLSGSKGGEVRRKAATSSGYGTTTPQRKEWQVEFSKNVY